MQNLRETGENWLHLSEDMLFDAAEGARLFGTEEEYWNALKLLRGMRNMTADLARAGMNVILDIVLEEKAWVDEWREVLEGVPSVLVGVHCPIEVLEPRERDRGDRHLGLARSHFQHVHAYADYDLEVDTSKEPATRIAQRIAQRANGA